MKPEHGAARFRPMRILITFVALLSMAVSPSFAKTHSAATSRGEQELAKLLAGATPGKPTSCLSSYQRNDSRTIDGIGVLYRQGRTSWLNRFQDDCPGLGYHTILVTRTPTDQLCRGDIAKLIDNSTGMFEGSCVLGDFVPYTKPKTR